MSLPRVAEKIVKLRNGEGTITTNLAGNEVVLTALAGTYPLKLVPARHSNQLACIFMVTYGGGLVAGDRIKLVVSVLAGSSLLLLTQGSTKVFKTRRSASPHVDHTLVMDDSTRQTMECTIDPTSSLFILPSPITCFARSLYSQTQSFHLTATSNLILLDWYTSGRVGRGEEWQFERYRSENRVFFEGKSVARDILLLEDLRDDDDKRHGGKTSYFERVAPYSCYATLMIFGPRNEKLKQHLLSSFDSISQYQQQKPYSLLWSYTALENGGGIARCAGDSTEAVRDWILEVLSQGGVEEMLGDLWSNVCS